MLTCSEVNDAAMVHNLRITGAVEIDGLLQSKWLESTRRRRETSCARRRPRRDRQNSKWPGDLCPIRARGSGRIAKGQTGGTGKASFVTVKADRVSKGGGRLRTNTYKGGRLKKALGMSAILAKQSGTFLPLSAREPTKFACKLASITRGKSSGQPYLRGRAMYAHW